MPVVRTTPAHKRKESEALASQIERTGFEMFLCSGYKKRKSKCVVSDKENSGRCSECVCLRRSCNVKGVPVDEWRSLKLKTDRLKQEGAIALRAI
jgi:hypothetical protein